MDRRLLIKHAKVLEVETGAYFEDHDVLSVNGLITEIGRDLSSDDDAEQLHAKGAVLIPGLIDAHVHVTGATADLAAMTRWSPTYVAAHAARIMGQMLHRGFTTVRDMSGADFGLAQAQAERLLEGPRLLFCGKALSQTGGHGDSRSAGQQAAEVAPCSAGIGRVADGVDQVRAAARDELRKGAHHLKVMASGGVASPTDRIDSTQYSMEELRAIVEEAEASNRYVAAHAYTARAINRALMAGAKSIEHGNLLDDESVDLLKRHGAFLVPTLVTYSALMEEGMDHGLTRSNWEKVERVLNAGMEALDRAVRGGVSVVFGSDLLGEMHRHQSREFRIRAEVQSGLEILRSATCTAAQLLGMVGEVGTIKVGARSDLVLIDADPLIDVDVLASPGQHIHCVVQDGRVVADHR